MSFAVTAVSKRLAEAGIDHIITQGGQLIVEAYDPKAMTGKPTKVVKVKGGWEITRSKKQIPSQEAYKLLMRLKRAAGYGKIEKKMAALRVGKTPNPERQKGAKKGWKTSPILKAKHKAAVDAKKTKKVVKVVKKAAPAAKKIVKVVKKVAKKVVKPVGRKRMV